MSNKKSIITGFLAAFFIFITASIWVFADNPIQKDEALELLREGNTRFIEMKLQHPNESIERREKTAINGQKPFAIVLACSDSRLPVETVFDRGIGDIFVIRVAGNIVMDSSVIGSIEYAAEHLHSSLLVILGHTECGAVEAAISGAHSEGRIRDIQKKIEPIVRRTEKECPKLRGSNLTNAVVRNNTLQAKADILSKSRMVKKLVDARKLRIATGVYAIKTGKVEWIH